MANKVIRTQISITHRKNGILQIVMEVAVQIARTTFISTS